MTKLEEIDFKQYEWKEIERKGTECPNCGKPMIINHKEIMCWDMIIGHCPHCSKQFELMKKVKKKVVKQTIDKKSYYYIAHKVLGKFVKQYGRSNGYETSFNDIIVKEGSLFSGENFLIYSAHI